MLEVISILAAALLLIITPIQTRQVLAGKISRRFKGSPAEYVVAYRGQLGIVMVLGAVCGMVNLGMIFLDSGSGEWVFDLLGATLWLGASAMSYLASRRLAKAPTPADAGGASA
jgi:hypothetical protein